MITTVVFDLDDTLYDEIEYCKSGFAAVGKFLAKLPEAPPAERISAVLWEQFTAGNRTKTFNAALDKLSMGYDDELIGELIEVYRNHNPKISLSQESRDVLCELSTKYTLALLTDGFLPTQKLKVQALKIEKYFKSIVYTEQLGRECWKPSPAGFEKIMQTLKGKPENMAYVADNEKKDFIAPNKLGFSTIQLIRPARIHTTVSGESGASAQHTICEISQLTGLLEKL
ncbi:MAG TPA: HAD family hydrolase [Sedimentisphaerales bacterium]|nr:HAD family hydrolase [Sedimentisphaerales bacterium]